MKSKGHKVRKRLEDERRSREEELKRVLAADMEAPPEKAGTEEGFRLTCDNCGEEWQCRALPRKGRAFAIKCRYCDQTEFVKRGKDGKAQLLPKNYKGKTIELDPTNFTPDKAFLRWWDAMPGKEYDERLKQARENLANRSEWLLLRKRKASTDTVYKRLRKVETDVLNLKYAAFEKIDRPTTERLRAARTRADQRLDWLLDNFTPPKPDELYNNERLEVSKEEDILLQIWLESGDRVGLKHPNLKENTRDKQRRQIASAKLAEESRRDKARQDADQYRLEQTAERLALADKRGHDAPLVAQPRWLIDAARDVVARERRVESWKVHDGFVGDLLPAGSLIYDFAAFIRPDDRRTWPTMKHLRMAFAERDEVIRATLSTMPRRRKGEVRKTRYSPDELLFLIDWWLNGKGASETGDHRAGFEHIKRALRYIM